MLMRRCSHTSVIFLGMMYDEEDEIEEKEKEKEIEKEREKEKEKEKKKEDSKDEGNYVLNICL